MKITRVWAMPNKDTFQVKPIGEFVLKYLNDASVSIDPFARNCDWATHRNDINPETDAQYHMNATDFLSLMLSNEIQADLVIFDPPYSLRQMKEVYNGVGLEFTQRDGQIMGRWNEERDRFTRLLKPSGLVLSFGWNSIGMGRKRGFEIIEILLVCHGGAHNDTICMAERMIQGRLLT